MESFLWIVLSYFIGAIPSGYIIGKVFYHVDLKKTGSGNIIWGCLIRSSFWHALSQPS